MKTNGASLFGSPEKVPQTLADFKVWMLTQYPNRKFAFDISRETYEILKNNQMKIEENKSDK